MTTMEQLGAHVSLSGGGLGAALRDKIALHIMDTAAAWIAGARAPEGKALAQFIAPQARGATLMDRVMLHCALARLSELDDIHLFSCTTPGAVVIPAALTLGAELRVPTSAIAEAILAGYEAMVRLGAALDGPSLLYRGIWPTYIAAPFGVAAVASRLLALDAGRSAHALALALTFASPGVGHPGGPKMARWLALGHAARHGATAAFAAQAGFTADLALLDRDFFASVYAISPRLPLLTQSLGSQFAIEELSFKPWCAARQTMAASQALKEMVAEGLASSDISGIAISVPPPYLRMVNHGVTLGDRASFLTSVSYQVAIGVLGPEAQFRINPEGEIAADVRDLMARVSVRAEERLLEHYPRNWPAHVTVSARSGEREKLMLCVPGDPERPLGKQGISDKFSKVLLPLVGATRAADLAASFLAALEGSANGLLGEIERACASA